jgi:hypothetical protein
MAIDSKFQTKSDVEVYIGTEITMGTATLAGGTWDKVPVVDYAIADKQAPLGVAPQRANSFGQQVSGAKHNRTEQMFEVSLTMHGTAGVIDRICGALFEDDDATNTLIGGSPATKTFDDGQSNSVPVTLLFKNGGSDGNDIHFKSAMCTSMELSYGIGTDGGALSCVATFVTGYIPIESTLTPSGGTITDVSGTVFNIHDLSIYTLGSVSNNILINDFSLNISRPVNRVSYQSTSEFAPYGYSIGGYEVTGTVGCKRDANSSAIPTNTSTGIELNIGDSTFEVTAPKVMVESVSTDLADEGWKQEFSYRAFYDDSGSNPENNTIVQIETA